MVQLVDKQIFLRDADGGVVPFDAGKLQTRLIGGFLATGLREDSFMAEEIVLALEYTHGKSIPKPVYFWQIRHLNRLENDARTPEFQIHLLPTSAKLRIIARQPTHILGIPPRK